MPENFKFSDFPKTLGKQKQPTPCSIALCLLLKGDHKTSHFSQKHHEMMLILLNTLSFLLLLSRSIIRDMAQHKSVS